MDANQYKECHRQQQSDGTKVNGIYICVCIYTGTLHEHACMHAPTYLHVHYLYVQMCFFTAGDVLEWAVVVVLMTWCWRWVKVLPTSDVVAVDVVVMT